MWVDAVYVRPGLEEPRFRLQLRLEGQVKGVREPVRGFIASTFPVPVGEDPGLVSAGDSVILLFCWLHSDLRLG